MSTHHVTDDNHIVSADYGAVPRQHAYWVVPLCAAAATVCLVFVLISGLVYWRDQHASARAVARTRDDVLAAARADIATVNTLDYHDGLSAVRRWSAVTAGALHAQLVQRRYAVARAISSARISTSAVVSDPTVTTLDVNHGTATVLASVELTKMPVTGPSVIDSHRVTASMIRVRSTWLLADLQPRCCSP